jgi:hypothetical protein
MPEDSSQWQGSKRLRIKFHSVAERLGSFSVGEDLGVSLARIEPVGFRTSAGARVLRATCVTIEQSYNRDSGCTIARWPGYANFESLLAEFKLLPAPHYKSS